MLTRVEHDFGRGPAAWLHGGKGEQPLHFAAANGFPVASYQFFLRHFADDFSLLGMENRGAWPHVQPPRGFNWQDHADDLIAFLEHQQTAPVVALGHSIGASVSALAAARRPDLFKALVMYDPATLPGRLLPKFPKLISPWVTRHIGLVKRTRGRRQQWTDHREFIDYHAQKPIYKRFSEQAFVDYANAVLSPVDDGYQLNYLPAWEAHNFSHVDSPWQALKTIKVPTLLLRAEHSYLYPPSVFEFHARRCSPCVDHSVIAGVGHMALQEDDEQVAAITRRWLSEQQLL